MTHRRALIVLIVVLLVAAGSIFSALWSDSDARPVDVDEARQRLGSSTTSAVVTPGSRRPANGVYLYRGSGFDRLTRPPKEQPQGPEMPATVTDDGQGCWRFEIDYSSNHRQSWRYCPTDAGLEEAGGETFQRWDFVVMSNESTSVFECDHATAIRAEQQPGDEWDQSCHSTEDPLTVSAGPYRFVGDEQLEIGDRTMTASHYHRERTMTGGQRGTERSEVWFAVDTGLPLRNERTIEVDTATVIGDVHYTEIANFELTSSTPVG